MLGGNRLSLFLACMGAGCFGELRRNKEQIEFDLKRDGAMKNSRKKKVETRKGVKKSTAGSTGAPVGKANLRLPIGATHDQHLLGVRRKRHTLRLPINSTPGYGGAVFWAKSCRLRSHRDWLPLIDPSRPMSVMHL